jgi:predicted dehydrogenase
MKEPIRIGFLGSGGIARSHAYALDVLRYYYSDAPRVEKVLAASPTPAHRETFAGRFGFQEAVDPEAVWKREDLDALYILGPNRTHTPQLLAAAEMPSVKRIYLEKPVAASKEDLHQLEQLDQNHPDKFIMVGFQFLQKAPIRKALAHWSSGVFGELVHFRAEYLHSSYLDPAYREKLPDRLHPIPRNGAAVDLGTHVLSLLTAFLGNRLVVRSARSTTGSLKDVPENTDLCTLALLEDIATGAVGTLTASRISAGTGDHLALELRGTKGAILFETGQPDSYLSYLPDEGWCRHDIYSDYRPASTFSSDYVPAGWLRALVHNHYLFLGGKPGISVIPDLAHGIQVQRLIQKIADHLKSN